MIMMDKKRIKKKRIRFTSIKIQENAGEGKPFEFDCNY